jgi:hypothetical protein
LDWIRQLNDITKLEDYFYEFYSMRNKNTSPAEIMKKVPIDIQPTMQKGKKYIT